MKKKIRTYLAEIFLISIGFTLGWFFYKHYILRIKILEQQMLIEELNITLGAENQRLKNSNKAFADAMKNEIKNEIFNEGKHTNIGLLDTLKVIMAKGDTMINEEHINFSKTLSYQRWVGNMYNSQLLFYNRDARLSAKEIDQLPTLEERILLQHSILSRERDLLELLNARLGTTHCGFGIRSRWGIGFPEETLVFEGDTLRLKLLPDWHFNIELAHMYFEIFPKFYSESGKIIQRELDHYATLAIPTDGKLKPYEDAAIFEYKALARFYHHDYPYEIPIEGTYKVIRRK